MSASAGTGHIKKHQKKMAGEYLVMLADGADPEATARDLAAIQGGTVKFIYRHAIKGFSVYTNEKSAERISRDPRVIQVEEAFPMTPSAVRPTYNSWNLDRIDTRPLSFDGNYTYTKTGAGVRVYVVDTGVNAVTYEIPSRRYELGYDATGCCGGDSWTMSPTRGHGSYVAQLIAGTTRGVAPGATIVDIKVLQYDNNATSSVSYVISGLDWAIHDHQNRPTTPAVLNMSLDYGGEQSRQWNTSYDFSIFDQAVISTIDSGIAFVAGAGNTDYSPSYIDPNTGEMFGGNPYSPSQGDPGYDACGAYPGGLGQGSRYGETLNNPHNRSTISVSSSTWSDMRAWQINGARYGWAANFGPCVDIFAPGVENYVTDVINGYTSTFSGTSAAAPMVTGVLALYLEGKTSYDPNQVETLMKQNATANVLQRIGNGSPNLLIYSLVDSWQ